MYVDCTTNIVTKEEICLYSKFIFSRLKLQKFRIIFKLKYVDFFRYIFYMCSLTKTQAF